VHASRFLGAQSSFLMPAMSPTMTEGSISEWKVKEGEPFASGDVLLSVETDKAAIDVEAQDDGIMGKILVGNGAAGVPVGKLIAVLAEEGDDLSKIEIPSEESTASSAASASSSTPATPSDAPTPSPATPSATPSAISNPRGSLPEDKPHGNHPANYYTATPKDVKKPVEIQLDGPTIRRMIAIGLGTAATPKPASPIAPTPSSFSFDSILNDYLPPAMRSTTPSGSAVPPPPAAASGNAFDAFLGM
ncbi:single hybrid motif-containing protein, partial [Rhodotorula sp. JG-1b]